MSTVLIVDTFTGTIFGSITSIIEMLPTLVIAVLIAVVGSLIGLGLGRFATELVNYMNVDSRAANTPLAAMFDGRPQVAAITGAAVKAYGVLFALYMAAGYAGFTGLASWLNRLVNYLPQLIGGLAIIAAGLIASAYAVRSVKRSASGLVQAVVAPVLKGVLYFMVVVVGVDTMGVNVQIVYVMGETLSTALGFGLALALGLAVGLGSKEYVAKNVEAWADGAGSAGGGMSTDDGMSGDSMGGDSMTTDDGMDSGMDDGGMDDDWDDGGDDWDDGGDDWDDGGVEDLSDDDWEEDF